MYQALLTRRYLTSKVMPLLASLAVTLCTAMVLIVWSVMGGFLNLLVQSGRTLVGDVTIAWPSTGFAFYDDLRARLDADPAVGASAPMIEAFGLVNLPNGRVDPVVIRGIEPASFSRVTSYRESLWWRPITEPNPKDVSERDWRLRHHNTWQEVFDAGMSLQRTDERGGAPRPAAVLGIEVSGFNIRQPGGWYIPGVPERVTRSGRETVDVVLPIEGTVTLNVAPLDRRGRAFEMVTRAFPVANEFHSGLYEIDKRTVFVPLASLQEMLKMTAGRRLLRDPADPDVGAGVRRAEDGTEQFDLPGAGPSASAEPAEGTIEDPARITSILLRAAEGVSTDQLKERARAIYEQFYKAHASKPEAKDALPGPDDIVVQTWEDQNATLIAAVKKETALVLFIFSFISLTAVFLVFAIFWAMVSEKTRDVGILRAVGASRAGVASLWLAYGLAIGCIGAALGYGLAWSIVSNINDIHDWLGRALGIEIWKAEIYYFSRIPTDLTPLKVALVLTGGMVTSVLGALVPAVRAATMQPVRALRFE